MEAPAAAEPKHGAFWWWLHGFGLAETRHEKAVLLRRAMGSRGGSIYMRDGVMLDVDQMSDDEVLALERETRGQRATGLLAGMAQPIYTSWGWNDTKKYRIARDELRTRGTHETLNGEVPTEEEAIRMIEEISGTVERVEDGHGLDSVSTHRERHINYLNEAGDKATVYIRSRK